MSEEEKTSEDTKEKEEEQGKDDMPDKGPKPKVLLAEDNPVVLKGLDNFMKKWGYESVAVSCGKEAWQQLNTDTSIRIAILDWNLPELTGMQICRALRVKRPSPYVYVIIFSSRSSNEEQVAALEYGADDYLIKPVKPTLLKARIGVGRRLINLLPK